MADKSGSGSGAGEDSGGHNVAMLLRASWATAKPSRQDYDKVVTKLNASKLVGEESVFKRGPHVPVTDMAYLKPLMDAFLTHLRQKDRRSAKEWEYINYAGVWAQVVQIAMVVAREEKGYVDEMKRRLKVAKNALDAVVEVLSMRAQYFRDITDQDM